MPTIITAENLRKQYQIGADQSAKYLRDTLGSRRAHVPGADDGDLVDHESDLV